MSQTESSRYGRVGSNARNESNEVFQFGSNLAYPNDKERFRNIDVAEAEKQRQSSDRERRQDRYDFRRQWRADIESDRWNRMATEFSREQDILKSKQSRARIGKNSVSYNPISLDYHKTKNGEMLAQEDAKAMYRVSLRSLNLYLKNNSFDPMKCQDVPRELSTDPVQTVERPPAPIAHAASDAPSKTPTLTPPRYGRRSHRPTPSNNSTGELYVPKVLFHTATSYGELVRQRLGDSGNNLSPKLTVNIQDAEKQHWARHY